MSTSDVTTVAADAAAMEGEIRRLANELFSTVPAGSSPSLPASSLPPSSLSPAPSGDPVTSSVAPIGSLATPPPLAGAGSPGWVSPPAWGPSALGMGAGGASPALTAPPIPGPLKQPPLPFAPPPKESDLRVIPGLVSDALGVSSPVALASTGEAATTTPYFLQIAGLPSAPLAPAASPTPPFAPPAPPAPPSATPAPAPATAAPQPLSLSSVPAAGSLALPTPPPDAPASSTRATPAYALPHSDPLAAGSDFWPQLVPDVAVSRPLFDGHAIKKDFPILRERVNGRPLVWLDNAATTQKPQVVIDRLSYFYEHENSNVHRAAHTLAARATDAYESARDTVRRFLNAPSARDIVFLRGTTEAINLVAQSWGARYVGAGDEIVITWLEHHANIVPWQMLCAEKGACLKVAPVDARGQVILDQYERLLGPRTRLVSFSHVSNALGTIVPAREMIEMAHRHGAVVVVDGAQAVSHMPVDVQALDCDLYCFSGHKIFAPTGIGALYGKREVLESMPPWQGGGNMISNVTFEKTTYQPPPQRFEAGTASIGDAVGLGAALDYVSGIGIENIARYEHDLLEYATGRLSTVPGLQMIGTAPEKAGVMSFVLDGVRTEDVGAELNQEGIAVRAGHHCAQPILRRYGLESTVRASLAPYNTREDVDALVAALLRLQGSRPPPPVSRNGA
ncbi:MAG TPA: family 2A encapsulin nanocompartment cargo protein cysteine desulfurase [Polyangiaceae bacterium]|nr:family 2A encapsulin nanocompartment cargo protein cysteine desulfurase [Polyangiaceae bacterium]